MVKIIDTSQIKKHEKKRKDCDKIEKLIKYNMHVQDHQKHLLKKKKKLLSNRKTIHNFRQLKKYTQT